MSWYAIDYEHDRDWERRIQEDDHADDREHHRRSGDHSLDDLLLEDRVDSTDVPLERNAFLKEGRIMGDWSRSWSTADEKEFIDNLGCCHLRENADRTAYTKTNEYREKRRRCLIGYIEAAQARPYWGNIDGIGVTIYAIDSLAKLHRRAGNVHRADTGAEGKED